MLFKLFHGFIEFGLSFHPGFHRLIEFVLRSGLGHCEFLDPRAVVVRFGIGECIVDFSDLFFEFGRALFELFDAF